MSRNTGQRGYRPSQANNFTQERHKSKSKAIKITEDIAPLIEAYVREDWSPEQIAGRLKSDGIIGLHHETIYPYILTSKKAGGKLYKPLRHQNKTYRKRYGHARNRTGIPHRVAIDERPEAANNRDRVGAWEADTVIGKSHKGAIVTLDDRKSTLRLAFPFPGKKAEGVKEAMRLLFKPIQSFVKTITFDNGKEFTLHET